MKRIYPFVLKLLFLFVLLAFIVPHTSLNTKIVNKAYAICIFSKICVDKDTIKDIKGIANKLYDASYDTIDKTIGAVKDIGGPYCDLLSDVITLNPAALMVTAGGSTAADVLIRKYGCGNIGGDSGDTHDDAWCQAHYSTPDACNNSNNECFYYAGYSGLDEQPKCVSTHPTSWGSACATKTAGGGCYSDQTCDQTSGRCYRTGTTPPPSTPSGSPTSGGNTCDTLNNYNEPNGQPHWVCRTACNSTEVKDPQSGQPHYRCDSLGSNYVCCVKKSLGTQSGGTTPAPGGGTTSPGGTTTTPNPGRPEAFACEFHHGQASYIGAFCGSADGKTHNSFDQTKAQARTFCPMTYIDAYKCVDGTDDYFPISGNSTCAQPPWCPSTVVTSTPGPDKNCTAYQGQTCHANDYTNSIYCCESNKNLECVKSGTSINYTCQYKGGVAFTPTPGASGNCVPGGYGGGIGCKCITGGGCTAGGCYPSAESTNTSDSSHWFCSSGLRTWCEKSQTTVPNASACGTATPYSTPTPTLPDISYQADCPNVNPGGSQNACILGGSCPAGYEQHSSTGTPGGTNGNRVCTEFEGGITAMCCTRVAGSPGPVVTSAPTPTPTPLPATYHPTGPWIPLSSVGACPAGLVGYWKGTYCDTDGTYYDVYCDATGTPWRNPAGQTCVH